MGKPRAWWTEGLELYDHQDYLHEGDPEFFKVIEKSAYIELKAEADKLAGALDWYSEVSVYKPRQWSDINGRHIGESFAEEEAGKKARAALTNWQKYLDGIEPEDPTPYCNCCEARYAEQCNCPPRAKND